MEHVLHQQLHIVQQGHQAVMAGAYLMHALGSLKVISSVLHGKGCLAVDLLLCLEVESATSHEIYVSKF